MLGLLFLLQLTIVLCQACKYHDCVVYKRYPVIGIMYWTILEQLKTEKMLNDVFVE